MNECRNDILDPVLFRVGIVAVVRSKFLGGKTIGIMITASHNPEIVIFKLCNTYLNTSIHSFQVKLRYVGQWGKDC
jgi:hypothetical protein